MGGSLLFLSRKIYIYISIQLKLQCPFSSGSGTTGPTPLPGFYTDIVHEPSTTIRKSAVGIDVVLHHLHKLPTLIPIKWVSNQISHITMCIDVCSSPLVL